MKKILIIEDDSFLQGLESTKLKKEGYETIAVSHKDEILKAIDTENADVILLDLMLPEIDGFDVLKKIRENLKFVKTPVVVFSNLSEDKDIDKAKALGANEFMVKASFTLDELVEKIKALLAAQTTSEDQP
ncbi:MAG: response regulator [Candidatus Paceibacterota bacterium]|jgi:DNA-binding response OmpR family regulator